MQNQTKCTIQFKAWIGSLNDYNPEHPLEYFTKEYQWIAEAKLLINRRACILWDEGEWSGHYLTISFKHNPGIFDSSGRKVSECRVIDWKKFTFQWFDKPPWLFDI